VCCSVCLLWNVLCVSCVCSLCVCSLPPFSTVCLDLPFLLLCVCLFVCYDVIFLFWITLRQAWLLLFLVTFPYLYVLLCWCCPVSFAMFFVCVHVCVKVASMLLSHCPRSICGTLICIVFFVLFSCFNFFSWL